MHLQKLQVYEKPSIYSHKPVIRMSVIVESSVNIPTKEITGLNEQLIRDFPGLAEHHCSKGYAGGFLERLEEGTYLPHVAEHLCLETLNVLGYDVKYGKSRKIDEELYEIIFAHRCAKVGEACGIFVIKYLNSIIGKTPLNFAEELKKLEQLRDRYTPGPSTLAIFQEARKRGIPVENVCDSGLLRLGYGINQRYISATLYEGTSSIATDIACDKFLAKCILSKESIPTPKGEVCISWEEALQAAQECRYPVVVKPKGGNQGKGVFVGISNDEELKWAFEQAQLLDSEVIVEKFIEGRDYRILVVDGRVVAAAERIPAHIKGDGILTVQQLIEQANRNEQRGEGHEKPLTRIEVDDEVHRVLKKQNLDLSSIPSLDQMVMLRENGNLSTGGTAIDCTDEIHPKNRELAEKAAKAIGLHIAGVDMVIPDISQPMDDEYGAVVEVNAAPGIRMHLYPSQGMPRNIASSILDMIYPPGSSAVIPIVSVTGTNGKTTTTRMIQHILEHSGYAVGATTTHGVYIGSECVKEGDTTGPVSAEQVLNDRRVEAAVLETARGGIVRNGLGYYKADVAVFTNLAEDHLGNDGIDTMEDLLYVKSLVVEAVKSDGASVLNADDPWVMKAREAARGKHILFSMDEKNNDLIQHLEEGGCGVFQKDREIVLAQGRSIQKVLSLEEIPAVMKGALRHNVYNTMAALAAAYALGITMEKIREALKTFSCDDNMNPGRFNIYEMDDFKVVLDYAHNVDGYKAAIEGLKSMNPSRLVGVIGVPGDRRDGDIREVGKLSGESFDRIIIKEDEELRGRYPLEVGNLLLQGVLESGMPRDRVEIIPKETKALEKAMADAEAGDVIAVFFEKMEPLVEMIKPVEGNHRIEQHEANASK